jgi:HK97 family phage major capsid protein
MLKLHELQEARAQAVAAMRALSDKAETEKRDLTAAEDTEFATLKTTIADLDKKIGRAQTLADAERSAPAIVHGRLGDGQYEERARDFSIIKSLRASLPRDLGGGDVDVGFEREISTEVARRSGRKFEGIAVPDQVFLQERRTLLVGSSAADLVPPGHRADLFIDRLRAKLVTASLGATYLDGLVGSPIDIPRQTGSSVAQWVGEDGSLSETDASFDDVTFTPKTVGAVTSMSRRTILNTSPAIEQIVRNDLAAVIASAIDLKAMIGDGSSNTPTGITNAGATDAGGGAALTWEEILNFIALVEGDSALMGSLGWAINPYVVKKLRSTLVAASTDSRMIMSEPNSLAGYPAVATPALPGTAPGTTASDVVAGTIIFGNWSDLLIGSWTGVDLLANPFEGTAYLKGRVLLRAMKDVDVQVRHPESFVYQDDVTT